jgi:uncharacterized membrane protein
MVASGHWSGGLAVLPFPPKEPFMTLTLYAATAAVFLILDAIMLTLVMKPLFTRHIGPLMAEPIRIAPAALFYLAYVAGLVYLVSLPAIKTGSPIVLPALIIGLMAYGTYEFTSWSIMKDWHWQMVATDVTWGGVLTTFSAWAGVTITRMIHG